MRTRHAGRRLALTSGLAGALAAAPAAAQQVPAPAGAARPAAAGAGCTYDECALRRERVFFSERLVAGTRGAVAARPRLFGAFRVDSIVRGIPEAEADARRYRAESVRGGLLGLAGTVLTAVAVVNGVRAGDDEGRNAGLLAGGIALNFAAAWRYQIADRSLNRALWWYNRSLPR